MGQEVGLSSSLGMRNRPVGDLCNGWAALYRSTSEGDNPSHSYLANKFVRLFATAFNVSYTGVRLDLADCMPPTKWAWT